jgi:hypothetical protein
MPVKVIIPAAIEEYIAMAAAELIPEDHSGRNEASILGRARPNETAPVAYTTGTAHVGSNG